MWLMDTINKIFRTNDNEGGKEHTAVIREMTFIGEGNTLEGIYVVQESINNGSIRNYCISATKEDHENIRYQLSHLKNKNVYFYLQSRLVIEPFIENDFEKVLTICRNKLPEFDINEYSIFML